LILASNRNISRSTPSTESQKTRRGFSNKYRKRNLRKQEDRDQFGNDLAADMNKAYQAQDWAEYDRIKALLYRTT